MRRELDPLDFYGRLRAQFAAARRRGIRARMKVLRTVVLLGFIGVFEAAIALNGVMAAARLIAVGSWLLCPLVLLGTVLLAVGAKLALCAAFFPQKEEPV